MKYGFRWIPLLFLVSCGITDAPVRMADEVINPPDIPFDHLEIVSGNGQSGVVNTALSENIVIAAIDATGKPMVGATIELKVESGSMQLGVEEIQTNSDGIASLSGKFGTTSGSSQVRATLLPDPDGDEIRTVHLDFVMIADAASKLVVAQGKANTDICEESTWIIKIADPYDNPIPDVLVSVDPENAKVNGGDVTYSAKTDAAGKMSFKVKSGTSAGTGKITIVGPNGLQKIQNLNYVRNFRFEIDQGITVNIPIGNRLTLTGHIQDGCLLYPLLDYRYGYNVPCDSMFQLPDMTSGGLAQTDIDGNLSLGVGLESSATIRCFDFRAESGGEVATTRVSVSWE